MTKEEMIELAKQAGFERLGHDDYDYVCYPDDIVAFAALVASAERDYERGFIDGMQKQMQSSVDKAVNRMAQPEQEPVALEEKFSLLLWDYQELERAFEKVTGGKWVRKSNTPQRTWVGLTLTQVKLLGEGVHEEAIKSGDSYNWVFYKHINEALKDKNK